MFNDVCVSQTERSASAPLREWNCRVRRFSSEIPPGGYGAAPAGGGLAPGGGAAAASIMPTPADAVAASAAAAPRGVWGR